MFHGKVRNITNILELSVWSCQVCQRLAETFGYHFSASASPSFVNGQIRVWIVVSWSTHVFPSSKTISRDVLANSSGSFIIFHVLPWNDDPNQVFGGVESIRNWSSTQLQIFQSCHPAKNAALDVLAPLFGWGKETVSPYVVFKNHVFGHLENHFFL